MNIWDVLILCAVAAALFFALRHIRRGGGSCSGCSARCCQCARCTKKTRRGLTG